MQDDIVYLGEINESIDIIINDNMNIASESVSFGADAFTEGAFFADSCLKDGAFFAEGALNDIAANEVAINVEIAKDVADDLKFVDDLVNKRETKLDQAF